MRGLVKRIRSRRRRPLIPVRLTLGGAVFMLAAAVLGLAGVDAGNNLLMMLFGLCVASLALNLCSGWRALRGLSVRRMVPDVLVAGQPFVIRYAVTNTRRWGTARCVHLLDELPLGGPLARPEAFVPSVRPGETVALDVPAFSAARGRLRFSTIRLSSRFPFGAFVKSSTLLREYEAAVFPALGQMVGEVSATSRSSDASGGGAGPARTAGDEEFYGVREYRAGDNPRRIHWRRSARTGQLMIREMARTYERQLWCVLNTRVDPEDREQVERLEHVISCAATVICATLERGAKVGLLCNGSPLLVLPPVGGRARRPRFLRELAIRSQNADDRLAPHIRRLAWPARWRGPCLLFSAIQDDDVTASEALLSRAIGQTTTYVPGGAAYEGLFRLNGGNGKQPAVGISPDKKMSAAEAIRIAHPGVRAR